MNRQELEKWLENFSNSYDSGKEELKDKDVIRSKTKNEYKYYDEEFYKEYTKLLNCRNDKFDVSFDEKHQIPGLKFVGKKEYYLKSDQFGFSRPDHEFKYPYAKYLEKVLKYDKENMENAIKKVITWMFKTRQVGGSFFWPLEKNNEKINLKNNPQYNLNRGKPYIQDRVDLTLLEVYQIYKSGVLVDKNDKVDLLEGNILYTNCFTDTMKSWLNEFGTFSDFVEFFALNPFVDQKTGRPYNLLAAKEDTPFKEVEERIPGIVDSNMTIEKYEKLFDRIVEKIEKRREILYYRYYNTEE